MSKFRGQAPTSRSPTVYALVERRAELSGEITAMKVKLRRMIEALDHIDFTIHLFDANYEITTIRDVPKLTYNLRGDSSTIILDALREATEPLSSAELARRLVAGRKLDPEDPKILNLFRARASSTAQFLRTKGVVRVAKKVGKMNHWEIVR